MADEDIANGTQFSDLPSCLLTEILLRLQLKALLICRYVRKDWSRLYFSNQYFVRQLETSNIHFLNKYPLREGKFRFGCFVDEVSTGNLRIQNLEHSCKLLHDPKYEWCVSNSCNGLVCVIDEKCIRHGTTGALRIYVCNPILMEWVSIPVPNINYSPLAHRKYSYALFWSLGLTLYALSCALGFCAKSNQYKILLCSKIGDLENSECKWEIYTLGTENWRSIETKENTAPWRNNDLDFNTFIHGSLHWVAASKRGGELVVQSFNFETERFTVLSLLKPESITDNMDVTLGIINGCLWVSFYYPYPLCSCCSNDAEMWAMKEYGVDKPWTTMGAWRENDHRNEALLARNKELVIYENPISRHYLLFPLNEEEILTWHWESSGFICHNIQRKRCRYPDEDGYSECGIGYNPNFVSLHDMFRSNGGATNIIS